MHLTSLKGMKQEQCKTIDLSTKTGKVKNQGASALAREVDGFEGAQIADAIAATRTQGRPLSR